MILRPATAEDIPAMHRIRLAVRENRLGDPLRVTPAHYARYVAEPGASWVAELDGQIAGFGVVDQPSRSLWALFVEPSFEGRGLGRVLLARLTEVLFESDDAPINLSTEPGTRAERMYRAAGWACAGRLSNGEVWLSRDRPRRR